jgi:uncharacterized protein
MNPPQWSVQVRDAQTSALFEPPTKGDAHTVFVCAHGAGGHMSDRAMVAVSAELRARGLSVVRFNFVYREQGTQRPQPMPELQACVRAVVEHARTALAPRRLLIGGRSMGGRAASMLAAQGFACDGLLLLAYPLHPAGRPEQLRDAHLPQIRQPVLCINGTRDTLCRKDLMDHVVEKLPATWTMHWLEGADHSFHVLKSSGRTDAQVLDETGGAVAAWLTRLP